MLRGPKKAQTLQAPVKAFRSMFQMKPAAKPAKPISPNPAPKAAAVPSLSERLQQMAAKTVKHEAPKPVAISAKKPAKARSAAIRKVKKVAAKKK